MTKEEAIRIIVEEQCMLNDIDIGEEAKLYTAYQMAIEALESQKSGKWLKAYGDHEAFGARPFYRYCSECNELTVWEYNYCPHCGARMGEEE